MSGMVGYIWLGFKFLTIGFLDPMQSKKIDQEIIETFLNILWEFKEDFFLLLEITLCNLLIINRVLFLTYNNFFNFFSNFYYSYKVRYY